MHGGEQAGFEHGRDEGKEGHQHGEEDIGFPKRAKRGDDGQLVQIKKP